MTPDYLKNHVTLTTKEAAAFIGISESKLTKIRASGNVGGPPFRRVFGRVVYLLSELIEWFDSTRVTTEPST